ncbi:hypothetical protein FBU31_007554, partial [Coemansia sp. 'formosensis']
MVSDNEQPSAALDDAGGFNLASSSLFGAQHNCAAPVNDIPDSGLNRPRASVRFDPLAQLLGSDTEEDTTDAVGDSDSEIGDKENSPVSRPSLPLASAHAAVLAAQITTTTTDDEDEEPVTPRRRPFTAARFALNKGDSIVARLASRRGRAVSDSSSDEDAVAALQFDGPRQRTMSSLRIDSDEDEPLAPMAASPPPPPAAAPAKAKKSRAPRKKAPAEDGVPKERPASKAAMAKIHQETERLVRETAVLINPLDYTQRLVLDDFFARFDLYASNASDPAATAVEPTPKPASLPQHTFHYESDSGDYEVEIIDEDITPAMGRVGILSPIKSPAATFKPRGSAADLDSILDYASQPLRSSAPTSSAMRPPTDGPMGLKQLNGALMRA